MRGICLRGLPGWGELFAPLTTVVNTFGGTWFTQDWKAQVNAPEFTEATKFYVDLVRNHGEAGAAQAGFTECLNAMSQGKVAMWYDATSAAGSLEDPNVQQGRRQGRLRRTRRSRRPRRPAGCGPGPGRCRPTRQERRQRREVHAVGLEQGVREARRSAARLVPGAVREAGSRPTRSRSTRRPPRRSATSRWSRSRASTRPTRACSRGPTVGIQFVAIPEFADVGTKVSQDISAAIAGDGNVGPALENGQQLAQAAGDKYKGS